MEYYPLELCGLSRELPLVYVSKKTRLAQFSILGDVELVNKLADVFARELGKTKFDCLVAPEVKVLPLVHGVALRLGHKRFVAGRREVRPYMVKPVIVKPLKHFPKHASKVVLNGSDAKMLAGKKVVIMDDVVSSGVTVRMMREMMKRVGASVVRVVAVLKQGEQFDDLEFFHLAKLPIFGSK